ncbi:MAG: DUF805 domain-containing protein [Pseudomonadota bacterium]
MGPAEAVGTCLAKYVTFSGRAGRAEFWWFFVFVAIGVMLMSMLDGVFGGAAATALPDRMRPQEGYEPLFEYGLPAPITGIFLALTALPFLAVGARRFHDRAMSGWWMIALLLPVAGWIVIAAFLALEGSEGDNAHGPVPAASGS